MFTNIYKTVYLKIVINNLYLLFYLGKVYKITRPSVYYHIVHTFNSVLQICIYC